MVSLRVGVARNLESGYAGLTPRGALPRGVSLGCYLPRLP
jgi:hypothetical protein